MPLERKPRIVKKVVEVLTDPNPQFISLVDHGANQTPFAALKSDTPPEPTHTMKHTAPAAPAAGTAPSAQTPVTRNDDTGTVSILPGFDIHRISFPQATYAKIADVEAYLTAQGFSGFEIVEKADEKAFVVDGIAEESFVEVCKIELPNGPTFFVGQLKEAPQDNAAKGDGAGAGTPEVVLNADDIKPLQALVKKFESWTPTSGTTLAQVMADMTQDGVPAGFYGVMDAFHKAFSNIVRSGQVSLISSLCDELKAPLTTLVTVFTTVAKSDGENADKLLAFAPPVTAPPSQEPVSKSDDPPPAAPAVDTVTKAEAQALVDAAVTDLLTKMDERITQAVAELVTKADLTASLGQVQDSVAKHDTRIARVERVRQVRKSDGDPAGGQPSSGPSGEGHKSSSAPGATNEPVPVSKSDANLFGIRTTVTRRVRP